jgi:hypothetical protein
MSLNLDSCGQMSLLTVGTWRIMVSVAPEHRLRVLYQLIPWQALMEKAKVILYDEHGICPDLGRPLDLRAHLGAYILQTVFNWTDRMTEEMIRFYVPARIFCGFLDSTGSLDHTSLVDFRIRFGEKGAKLITQDMLKVAREFGLTQPDDVDMDTTVQGAGITHPTEMKLMKALFKKAATIHKKLKGLGRKGIKGIKKTLKKFAELHTEYRFYAKSKEAKNKIIRKSVTLSEQVLTELCKLIPGAKDFDALSHRYQIDILKILELGPRLLEQIMHWVETGKVAQDKIISLWKMVPQAIKKGKLSKPVEFGRKWIVNCYQGGYVLLTAPENPKLSDQDAVLESLSLHQEVFKKGPGSYATDRGMWGQPNLELLLSSGVENIGIQPKGKAKPLVSKEELLRLSNRRAGIEPRIGHLKNRGLGISRMKSDVGDLISGHRSAISYNISLLLRDLSLQPALLRWV